MSISGITSAMPSYASMSTAPSPAKNPAGADSGKVAAQRKDDPAYTVEIAPISAEEQAELERCAALDEVSPAEARRLFLEARREEVGGSQSEEGGFGVLAKCLTIARHLMNGDRVPKEDIAYLIENAAEMYERAMLLRQRKEQAEEVERISEEESSETSADAQSSGGVEAVESTGEADAAASEVESSGYGETPT